MYCRYLPRPRLCLRGDSCGPMALGDTTEPGVLTGREQPVEQDALDRRAPGRSRG